jgi:hypothetical protein
MSEPQIHGRRASFSANKVLETLGESLDLIRGQDKLTWKDIGRTLGKSSDRAAAYADGDGDMGIVSFLLGCREWNGRFANKALGMIGMKLVPLESVPNSDRAYASALARLQAKVNAALENDDIIDQDEIDGMRADLDEVARGTDARRGLRAVGQ